MGWRQLGQQIRTLRGDRFTQAKLASRVGVSTIYIRKLEAGERNASFEVLERLAEALEATLRVDLIKRRKGGRPWG
jgi:transcriptional regulator with XRE-family HTH domain